MKVCGIVCEYNPFHNGHEYHIAQSRERGADFIICVMSGSFVQRGSAAIMDKWSRAEAALRGGADIVLELPTLYALSSAEYFAYGAVGLLHALGVCTHLSFGSESELSSMHTAANLLMKEPEELSEIIVDMLDQGLSYPAARAKALASYLRESPALGGILQALSMPNSVLGIEYIKALHRLNSSIMPIAIPRAGSSYHDLDLNPMASASAIRKALAENNTQAALDAMPEYARKIITREMFAGHIISTAQMDKLTLYSLRMKSLKHLAELPDVTEGLENRLLANTSQPTYEDYLNAVKTKRYTHARLTRIGSYSLLNITRDTLESCQYTQGPAYARVLGFNKNASSLLASINNNSRLPIVTSVADALNSLPEHAKNMLQVDITATNVQALGFSSPSQSIGSMDYTHPLVIL